MNCKKVKYLLSEYIDDLLNNDQKQMVDDHLKECTSCVAALDNLLNYKSEIKQIKNFSAPLHLEDKVFAAIENKRPVHLSIHNTAWFKIAVAAVLLGLIYFILPDNYFTTHKIDLQYQPYEKPKSKGPVQIKKRSRSKDFRIEQVQQFLEKYSGVIIKKYPENEAGIIDYLVAKIPKKEYSGFASELNEEQILNKLPENIPFSLKRNIEITIYFDQRKFYTGDINGDHYDDLLIFYTYGKFKNQFFASLNNKKGHFQKPIPIIINDSLNLISHQTIFTLADINGDNFDDLLALSNEGNKAGDWYVFKNNHQLGFEHTILLQFDNDKLKYFSDHPPVSGDFNADGYDDLGIRLKNSWVLFLNKKNYYFDEGFQTKQDTFSDKYFPFSFDFNNDGFNDLLLKHNRDKESNQWYIFNNELFEFNSIINLNFHGRLNRYKNVHLIYTGDFNYDGFDDLLVFYGDNITLGPCFISLNNQNGMMNLHYRVNFEGEEYLPLSINK